MFPAVLGIFLNLTDQGLVTDLNNRIRLVVSVLLL